MSVTSVSEQVKFRLWGKAAGCCQYENCSHPLYYDQLTKAEFNTAYIAHIYADQPKGPRYDAVLSSKLQADISNLMLLCDEHHRLVDKVAVKEHPAERLLAMKEQHERRIELVSKILPAKGSHILLYGAAIGNHRSPLSYLEAASAIIHTNLPANNYAIELGMKNAYQTDDSTDYWNIEASNLHRLFNLKVESLKGNHEIQHFSVFALAPQPLLILLGTLLSDIYIAEVYQRHREPASWQWQLQADASDFALVEPENKSGVPALVFELSGNVSDDRIQKILGTDCSIWKIKIDSPHNDFLKTREQLSSFRKICRRIFNKIKIAHGEDSLIHLFPIMPVSAAVELGRVWMPKADLPIIIYDQHRSNNGFTQTLTIKNELLCYQ
ncbi:MAG: SAVED domain-containing protein [Chitinophagaceae bacterium]|nr:SAVED domain-containing protein [Chitinophagaceae bacterium]MDP1764524.1 SAVED domain-containing protein [Sediminibacterium sp.]